MKKIMRFFALISFTWVLACYRFKTCCWCYPES